MRIQFIKYHVYTPPLDLLNVKSYFKLKMKYDEDFKKFIFTW